MLMDGNAPNKRCLSFTAPEGVVGKYTFTLSQKDPRLFPRHGADRGREDQKTTARSKLAIWSYDGGDDPLSGFEFVDAAGPKDKRFINLTVSV